MEDQRLGRLADLFRVLADPVRLQILGRLAERSLTGRELAEQLKLTAPTISHHMGRLLAADLVTVTPDAQRRIYRLNQTMLQRLTREATTLTAPEVPGQGESASAGSRSAIGAAEELEREKVLRGFFDGPRLKQIPAQRKKRVVVLQHLMERFAPDHDYPEKEVNRLLAEAHEDVATLRRELVDYGFMNRSGGIYRVATALPARGATVGQEISGDETVWLQRLIASATAQALRAT